MQHAKASGVAESNRSSLAAQRTAPFRKAIGMAFVYLVLVLGGAIRSWPPVGHPLLRSVDDVEVAIAINASLLIHRVVNDD